MQKKKKKEKKKITKILPPIGWLHLPIFAVYNWQIMLKQEKRNTVEQFAIHNHAKLKIQIVKSKEKPSRYEKKRGRFPHFFGPKICVWILAAIFWVLFSKINCGVSMMNWKKIMTYLVRERIKLEIQFKINFL